MALTTDTADCATCVTGLYGVYGPTIRDDSDVVQCRRIAVKSFAARQVLVPAGQAVDVAMTLREGWACRFKLFADGRRHILSFLIPGDTILLELLAVPSFKPPYAVKSLTPVTVCLFDIQDYRKIVTSSAEQEAQFNTCIQHYGAALYRRQIDLGRRSATARIAQLLIELDMRLRERNLVREEGLPFPLRQSEISDATGLTTAHVNRVFSQLRRSGVIESRERWLVIQDRQRLSQLAEAD